MSLTGCRSKFWLLFACAEIWFLIVSCRTKSIYFFKKQRHGVFFVCYSLATSFEKKNQITGRIPSHMVTSLARLQVLLIKIKPYLKPLWIRTKKSTRTVQGTRKTPLIKKLMAGLRNNMVQLQCMCH